ncbi:chorismate mutase [Xenorhabdus sp. IM139775]|uniref:chorismate mutase n=1 Tax=Xenorhabdus sp. IM139775 TaxID=3025876 RepID=UPI0023585198|nr:chorismate mutase [Xenorhabdus sp. IM139775]MDC9592413.1 chorismate mutase [Xenorhabdus sp. IM139775]
MSYLSISDVRKQIDVIDSQLVKLIAQRGECVKAAAAFKKDTQDVKAPDRVQQVIDKVSILAEEYGLSQEIIQKVYRSMIDAFIDFEIKQHQFINQTEEK